MRDFVTRLGIGRRKSANQAKDRLKLMLIHDRSEVSPGVLDLIKDDLIDVISRHVEIDSGGVQIEVTRDGRENRLIADIPLLPSRQNRHRRGRR